MSSHWSQWSTWCNNIAWFSNPFSGPINIVTAKQPLYKVDKIHYANDNASVWVFTNKFKLASFLCHSLNFGEVLSSWGLSLRWILQVETFCRFFFDKMKSSSSSSSSFLSLAFRFSVLITVFVTTCFSFTVDVFLTDVTFVGEASFCCWLFFSFFSCTFFASSAGSKPHSIILNNEK